MDYENLKPGDTVTWVCKHCGKEFEARWSKGIRIYCSNQCAGAARTAAANARKAEEAKAKAAKREKLERDKQQRLKFSCKFCGKVSTVKFPCFVREYCSSACKQKAQWVQQHSQMGGKSEWGGQCFDPELDWQMHDQRRWNCPYQEGVVCMSRVCTRCGWFPEVAVKRSAGIVMELILGGGV